MTTLNDEQESPDFFIYSPVCALCVHLTDPTEHRCAAFGETRIPDAIWRGDNSHTSPVLGDHGMLFERGTAAALVT